MKTIYSDDIVTIKQAVTEAIVISCTQTPDVEAIIQVDGRSLTVSRGDKNEIRIDARGSVEIRKIRG